MTFKEVDRKLREDGWVEKLPRKKGSRRQYIHPFKPGKVTISEHSGRDFPIKTLKSIEAQSGVKLR